MIRSFLAGTLVFLTLVGPTFAADYKILLATWRGCEEACRGFQDYLAEKGVNAEFLIRDAAQKEEAIKGILAEARAKQVDLILTWGTNVTQGIAGTLNDLGDSAYNHEIPQVL